MVELGHEDLVVLPEGVGVVEEFAEEVEPLTRDREQLVGVEVLRHRAPAEQPQGDARVLVRGDVVPARDEREQVGAEGRRLLVLSANAPVCLRLR